MKFSNRLEGCRITKATRGREQRAWRGNRAVEAWPEVETCSRVRRDKVFLTMIAGDCMWTGRKDVEIAQLQSQHYVPYRIVPYLFSCSIPVYRRRLFADSSLRPSAGIPARLCYEILPVSGSFSLNLLLLVHVVAPPVPGAVPGCLFPCGAWFLPGTLGTLGPSQKIRTGGLDRVCSAVQCSVKQSWSITM